MTTRSSRVRRAALGAAAAVAAVVGLGAPTAALASPASAGASAAPSVPAVGTVGHLANLAHLNALLGHPTPPAQSGHSTYRLTQEPALTAPWVYANRQGDGSYSVVGGGTYDPTTGDYGQGAYDADDISRAAVVYLRDWKQNGTASSRTTAYEVLRTLAYFQTTTGSDAGNVVLWMQPDGTLNPEPTPADDPNPSDSGASYWLARTIWAFGEGYADFRRSDPSFASFLRDRLDLALGALQREALNRFGTYEVSDGVRVPAWLIGDGADESAEAVLGLAPYVTAAPDDVAARTALRELATGVAAMASGSSRQWPYGAILPWADSTSMWHAYASQMPAALALASQTLRDRSLLAPAVTDSTVFDPILFASGGPDNAWYPTPVDRTQIAYGVDSRLQSLLAVGDSTGSSGIAALAAIDASWYFGTNASGAPVYSPSSGVTYDGVAADGTVNRNSGAESTIHGLLSMLALDAHPSIERQAMSLTDVRSRNGISVVSGAAASPTTGTIEHLATAWTGESQYTGTTALQLALGQSAEWTIGTAAGARWVEPVEWFDQDAVSGSTWSSGGAALGSVRASAGAQGVSPVPGVLRPVSLATPVPGTVSTVDAVGTAGTTTVDSLIVRPVVTSLAFGGASRIQLLASTSPSTESIAAGWSGSTSVLRVYDATGRQLASRMLRGATSVRLPAGCFAIVTPR